MLHHLNLQIIVISNRTFFFPLKIWIELKYTFHYFLLPLKKYFQRLQWKFFIWLIKIKNNWPPLVDQAIFHINKFYIWVSRISLNDNQLLLFKLSSITSQVVIAQLWAKGIKRMEDNNSFSLLKLFLFILKRKRKKDSGLDQKVISSL